MKHVICISIGIFITLVTLGVRIELLESRVDALQVRVDRLEKSLDGAVATMQDNAQ